MCPKDKLFKGYIELEIELREFDRCRTLYEKYIEFNPQNCTTWIKFAELESILGDLERTRAIYELAIEQPLLDMPEIIWKSYIDFEIDQEEHDKVRKLYRRLLARTQHVKVWLSYAQFETNLASRKNSADEDESEARTSPNYDTVREVYKKAFDELKSNSNKETRVMILEAWKDFEVSDQDQESIYKSHLVVLISFNFVFLGQCEPGPSQSGLCHQSHAKGNPQTPKDPIGGRSKCQNSARSFGLGDHDQLIFLFMFAFKSDAGWEEYTDYVFNDDEAAQPSLKILAMAKKWKQTNVESS